MSRQDPHFTEGDREGFWEEATFMLRLKCELEVAWRTRSRGRTWQRKPL